MADLSDLQAAGYTKIVGSDSSGVETNPAKVSANQDLSTSDIIDNGGTYGTLTVGTSAVALRVAGSNLANRKLLTIDNTSNSTIFWGYDNSLTTSNYAGRIFKDQQASWAIGPNANIFLIAAGAGNVVHVSEGA